MRHHAAANPFRVEQLHRVPYWDPALDWERLLAKIESRRCRGAIVGPHGHGKTTLLLELARRLQQAGHAVAHHTLGDADRVEASLVADPATIYLLDGAERLGPLRWRAFRWRMRAARGIIITAHRPGRLPTLHHCVTTPGTVAHLVQQLAPAHALALAPRIPRLHEQHQGDCRRILFQLYDEFAVRTESPPV